MAVTDPATRPAALRAKVRLARAAGALSRRAGRGGTSLPGKLLLTLDPHAVGRLAAELPGGSAVISATNGKTTTAALAATILERAGRRPVHNRAGANMAGGIAGALLQRDGDADIGLFEIDEFWLDGLVGELQPRVLLLGNLFRDQLDRYGEIETIAARWAAMAQAATSTTLVINGDDPFVAELGGDGRVVYGIEDPRVAVAAGDHAADAKRCRRCGAAYVYDRVFLGHLGHYHCDACGARRPVPDVTATEIALDGLTGSSFTLNTGQGSCRVGLPLPGLYNVYNALGAAALTLALGVSLEQVAAGIAATPPAFGRGETVTIGGRQLLMLLVKNPAGANEVLRTVALEDGPLRVLAVLNDRIADGRDVSWIWDADYELLDGRRVEVVCSGDRADELALRLKYAGIEPRNITVEHELGAALDRALALPGTGKVIALPTYTAMLALRDLLVDRGAAKESFA